MKNLVFIEDFSSKYHLPEGDIIALNVKSHYELLKREIDHFTISDLVDFESYLTHSEAYNDHQERFFKYCDKDYNSNRINNRVEFAPYRIIGFEIKTVFDSLFSQTLIIYEIIKKIKPQKIYLLSSYVKHTSKQINYFEHSRGNYYDFLFSEILEYLVTIIYYDFEIITIPKKLSFTISAQKEGLKDRIRNTKYFNIYRQLPLTKNVSSFDVNYFETIVNSKNLFMNQGWGLNKLINYSLISNPETIVLLNNYLFIYNGLRMSKCFPVKIDDVIQPVISSSKIEKHVTYFDNFVKEAMGISLYTLIDKRITFLNENIFPTLYYGCKTIDKALNELKVEKVIGNMKNTITQNFSTNITTHILPFLSTYDSNYDCLYFTHGFDPYIVDRTFLELPCNYYFTHNEEYKNYFNHSFKHQNIYEVPKTEVFEL